MRVIKCDVEAETFHTSGTFLHFPQGGYVDTETLDLGATRKAFKCDQCKERFASMIGLKNHVQSDHKKAKELPKMHKGRTTK